MPIPSAAALPPALLGVALATWSPFAMSDSPASRIGHFHLAAPPARVLPLFTAEGERSWALGWEPEQLSEQRGSVFRTRHGGRETTWVVTEYQPAEGRASYARLAVGSNMGLVEVRCRAADGGTEVSVRYTLTGLNAAGREEVRAFLEPAHYAAMMEEWRQATSAALVHDGDKR